MWRGIVLAGGVLVAAGGVLTVGFMWSFRTKFRPVQDAIRRMNRAVLNPRQLRAAGQPGAHASVVNHVGRTSGTRYRTPVVAVPTDDGFVIALPYGPGTDWVRNVVAAGSATIEHDGRTMPVERAELVPADDVNPLFPDREQHIHRRFGVTDFLLVRRASGT